MNKKPKTVAATINTALKTGDTTRPIIGRDAHAPKTGNGTAAKKTLTQLVKEAQDAAEMARDNWQRAAKHSNKAMEYEALANAKSLAAAHSARTAKWCAAIAAASAIISIITAAIQL